jgi:formate dehydrogenase subunit gamma
MHIPSDSSEFDPSEELIQHVARQALEQYRDQKGSLLPILHAIQHDLGYVPPSVVGTLADDLNLSRAEIHGVISFYAHFRTEKAGPVLLEVCRAEACQSMGGETLAAHARQRLGCDFHNTTANGAVTLEPVYCLGLCAQSPAVMINGRPYARMTADKLDRALATKGV